MPASPPHDGPCKGCGATDDVTTAGRYRGLCGACRKNPDMTRRKSKPGDAAADDGMTREDFVDKRPTLATTCRQLTKRAEKLEEALAARKLAQSRAKTELALFREALQAVGRVAQSLVNASNGREASE